jgi:hypothetical protein
LVESFCIEPPQSPVVHLENCPILLFGCSQYIHSAFNSSGMIRTKVSVRRLLQSIERLGSVKTFLERVIPDKVWLQVFVTITFALLTTKTEVALDRSRKRLASVSFLWVDVFVSGCFVR